MEAIEIFTMALGLQEPWYVTKAEFVNCEDSSKELHIWIDFTKGYKFCFGNGLAYPAYDTVEKVVNVQLLLISFKQSTFEYPVLC